MQTGFSLPCPTPTAPSALSHPQLVFWTKPHPRPSESLHTPWFFLGWKEICRVWSISSPLHVILISLIKVNLIKGGTAEKNKSTEVGGQGSHSVPQRQGFVAGEPLQGTEGSSMLSTSSVWPMGCPELLATLAARPDLPTALQHSQHSQGGI